MPLLTKPLSPQERRALALRRAGKTNQEIGEEMMIADEHVRSIMTHAKRKGADVPKAPRAKPRCVPIERLVEIRRQLTQTGRRGVYPIIAERTGLKVNCVRVRLWRYDQQHQRGGEHEPSSTH